MRTVRIESVGPPFNRAPGAAGAARELLLRAETMGLLPQAVDGSTRLDATLLEGLAKTLRSAGVATAQADRLESARGKALTRTLEEALAAIEASPHPPGEWGPARELLGDDLLAVLVGGISASSLRRYATGQRETPDEVAWRLHLLTHILSSLRSAYNTYGIRRWFERPRSQLDGATPGRRLIEAKNEEEAHEVVELAEALRGSGFAT